MAGKSHARWLQHEVIVFGRDLGAGWVCWFVKHAWMWGRGLSEHYQPGLPQALLGANIQMLICSINNSCRNGSEGLVGAVPLGDPPMGVTGTYESPCALVPKPEATTGATPVQGQQSQ